MKNNTQTIARKIFILCSLFFALVANAQAPENIGFQAVIRNSSNALVSNANVGIKISILQSSATGTAVFSQTQTATTNDNGLVNITFGAGGFAIGDFAAIDWGNGPYFIKTETDPTGGTNYTITSTTQMISVPYALYAKTSGSVANTNAWSLGGNTGTNINNFIGTIDDNDLQLKVNNQKAGVIETNDETTNNVKNANTGLGYQTLNANTTGAGNTSIGYQSLFSNIDGGSNTGVGHKTLYSNTIGWDNTALGNGALYANTSGIENTAIGYLALQSNTTGYKNSATGNAALYNNTLGFNNVANGYKSLYSNTSGSYNVANGTSALYSNTFGGFNVANGAAALYNNTYGQNNVANGTEALFSNISGGLNVANGFRSLYSNTSGDYNVANGTKALYSNTTGEKNTAMGNEALYSNSTGNSNTAVGNGSLHENTTANYNVALGRDALYNITTGGYNTAIGYQAGFNLNNGAVYNTTSIGYLSGQSSTTSNHITVGNGGVTSIGGIVGWTNFSDKRIKTNIQENVPGLNFIKLLKPVTYNFDTAKQFAMTHNGKKDDTPDYPGKNDIENIKFSGFLAQDVETAAKSIGYDFSGVDAPKDANGIYGLRYAEFVVPMVKAIQEQQAIIEKLEAKIKELENKK